MIRLFPKLYTTYGGGIHHFTRKGSRWQLYQGAVQHQWVAIRRVLPGLWVECSTPFYDWDTMFNRGRLVDE